MRIVPKIIMMLLLLPVVASCKKDEQPQQPQSEEVTPFYLEGMGYADLQQAVDAATDMNTEGTATIYLMQNATGKGAVINAVSEDDITIDFQSFQYILEPGCSLKVSGNILVLDGEDGYITGSDDTPLLVVTDSGLVALSDGVTLDAKNVISAANSAVVTFDYTGSVSGNINLDEAEFCLFDSECSIHVPVLSVKGENAVFMADTESEAPHYSAKIDSLISDNPHPVTSVRKDIIHVEGAEVHIHNMKTTYVPGSCIVPARIDMTCKDCGFETFRLQETYGHCPAEYLVHHEAVDSTELECGNDEFWECMLCGKAYSDKDGENELTDGALRLAKAFSLDGDLLHGLDGILDWDDEFDTTKAVDPLSVAGVVLSVVGILETLGLSIPGLVKSDAEKWQQVNDKLDAIKAQLDLIDKKIDRILYEIQTIPCKTEINSRSKELAFLKTNTMNAFSVISDIVTKLNATDEEKVRKIKDVISDWITPTYKGDHPQDLTQSMVANYYDRPTGMNYPEMYGQFVNGISRWEHEGYNLRYQMMLNDLAVVGEAYCLTGIYLQDMAEFKSEDMRDKQVQSLKESFNKYTKAVKDELDRIKERDQKYRQFNIDHVTFERTVNKYDFRKWFVDNRNRCFPRNNDGGKAVESCNAIMKHFGLDCSYITGAQARNIYAVYNKGKKAENAVSIYQILADSVKFYKCPSKYDPDIIFTMKNDNFSHEGGDVAIPTYKMWHWEVYRSRNNHDYFGIYTCLNKEANELNHNILYNCDINSRSGGKINRLGDETKWKWYTILVAQ